MRQPVAWQHAARHSRPPALTRPWTASAVRRPRARKAGACWDSCRQTTNTRITTSLNPQILHYHNTTQHNNIAPQHPRPTKSLNPPTTLLNPPADDEAFAALDAAIEGAELCKFGLGPSTARRDMDAYLASHAGLAGRVTTGTIYEMFHWSNALIPTMLTSDGGKALATMGAEEFAQALSLKPYEAERAKIKAVYDAYLSNAGASFLLTTCTSGPPTYLAGEGEGSFVKLEAAALAAKEAGDMKARFMATLALYMPKISLISAKAVDFAIPSIAIPTAARHECGGPSLPAGVLAWGPVRSDRRLIEFGLALEARLANKS